MTDNKSPTFEELFPSLKERMRNAEDYIIEDVQKYTRDVQRIREAILSVRRNCCMEADRRDDDSYCHEEPYCDACEILNKVLEELCLEKV